jgi:Holliday junction resolvase RusA-like endonuclease
MSLFFKMNIHGDPQSQPRHRHTARGKIVRTYDPKSKDKKKLAKYITENYSFEKTDKPLLVVIQADFKIPSSLSKVKKGLAVGRYRPKKPDIDNIAKYYLDAMNDVVYFDDAQIVALNVVKKYSLKPNVRIELYFA